MNQNFCSCPAYKKRAMHLDTVQWKCRAHTIMICKYCSILSPLQEKKYSIYCSFVRVFEVDAELERRLEEVSYLRG